MLISEDELAKELCRLDGVDPYELCRYWREPFRVTLDLVYAEPEYEREPFPAWHAYKTKARKLLAKVRDADQ